jgi:hypothetical protein
MIIAMIILAVVILYICINCTCAWEPMGLYPSFKNCDSCPIKECWLRKDLTNSLEIKYSKKIK